MKGGRGYACGGMGLGFWGALVLTLVVPWASWAETVDFGEQEKLYSVTVPDNWEAETLDSALQLTKKDRQASMSISCVSKEELTLESLQRTMPTRLGLGEVKKSERKDGVAISGTVNGQALTVEVRERNDVWILLVLVGVEKKEVEAVVATLRRKDGKVYEGEQKPEEKDRGRSKTSREKTRS